ncbi:hypothetical protein ACHAWT_002092 [Skeletonema menzelii]
MATSLTGLVGATLMVAATTADDAIWLVPYTSPSLPFCTRLIHGALFIATLEVLVCISVAVASGLQWAVSDGKNEEILLGSIGAGFCWIIAAALYIKKWLKRRRRAAAQSQFQQQTTHPTDNYGSIDRPEDGTGELLQDAEQSLSCKADSDDEDDDRIQLSPWAVVSFTFLGALDEISYFPSLVLGGLFTPLDLCLGTFFASCIVLVVVTLFLSRCKPLLDWLDDIPLYNIVGTFAIVLTAGVVWDVLADNDD